MNIFTQAFRDEWDATTDILMHMTKKAITQRAIDEGLFTESEMKKRCRKMTKAELARHIACHETWCKPD